MTKPKKPRKLTQKQQSAGWRKIVFRSCDLCSRRAIFANVLGGMRCGKCPRPLSGKDIHMVPR